MLEEIFNDEDEEIPVRQEEEISSLNAFGRQWEKLEKIPVNSDDEIMKSFLHFSVGTDKVEVWNWIERKFNAAIEQSI
jgi:hypothetical protein